VPYNEPWRAGANENTTVTFSSDVKVGGKPLKAGTYGLHMIPTAKEWTIAFSNVSTAWGSFTYDQKGQPCASSVTPVVEDRGACVRACAGRLTLSPSTMYRDQGDAGAALGRSCRCRSRSRSTRPRS
jgi:hypothetical protein